MGKPRPFFIYLDGRSQYFLPTDLFVSRSSGVQFFSSIGSFVDSSFNQSRNVIVPSSLAFCEAFNRFSRFAGAIVFWFSNKRDSNIGSKLEMKHRLGQERCKSSAQINSIESSKDDLSSRKSSSKSNPFTQLFGGKISSFSSKYIFKISQQLQELSVAAAVVPRLNMMPNLLALPVEKTGVLMPSSMEPRPCQVKHRGFTDLLVHDMNRARHAVEPRTGIKFPTILKDSSEEESHFSSPSEVLVGTGAKTMTFIKIKSLRIYAYALYVEPYSVCEKLGSKYASIPVAELKQRHDFYEDLLREDINMTVRLVVNCNGMKISSVKDAFEKSLRARLVKANPHTDYECLGIFGSCFTRDIPLRTGTTIDFRRMEDGRLLTEIEGNLIGAVQSKDLCRAFFDMYIGNCPISEQTKEDIGSNIASIIGRC
ncbi:Fatty-acid-binding protein 2-like protein [Drosera capensis]